MTLRPLIALLFLAACRAATDGAPSDDLDADGVSASQGDCDDADASVRPGAAEVPYDGIDQDCDPSTADDDVDADGTPVADDCDDANDAVNPDAVEACNGIDDDCDGRVDLDAADGVSGWADTDADGAGDPAAPGVFCEGASGWSAEPTDCDDADAEVRPGALETCDGVDNDCDGTIDLGAPDAPAWYADADADGYGAGEPVQACTADGAVASVDGDCDDADPTVHPGAVESCDAVDRDCDGSATAGAADAPLWYADADADGYGDPASPVASCDAPADAVADDTDCDDGSDDIHPGAAEAPDGMDTDCDGLD